MKTVKVKASGCYDVKIGRGLLDTLGTELSALASGSVLIVTDTNVAPLWLECAEASLKAAGFSVYSAVLPAGEQSKNLENYGKLLRLLADKRLTRTDTVLALGGGVVGDLAGFAAAVYMRGIDFYNIPTTVLSQVDSSIGGKVAIDFEGYKNIVGAFYPPKAVIIDSNTLKTLPERQISNGLAESVKMSLTSDKELFELFEKGDIKENIDTIIEKSLKIKRAVVEQDEKEDDLRKILNFGHTLAHAIESENEMQNLYHGECVALGMIPMCSEEVKNRLIPVLERLNLPTSTAVTADTIINAMRHDKKMSGDKITVILVNTVGEYEMKEMPFDMFAEKIRGSLG